MNNHLISTESTIKLRNLLAVSQNEPVEFEFSFEENSFFIRNKNNENKKILLGQRIKNLTKIFPEPLNPLYDLSQLVFDESNERHDLSLDQRNVYILKRFQELTSMLNLNEQYE